MEAKELRIGNYVYDNYREVYKLIVKSDFLNLDYRIEFDILKPIPLTEEILLKCGFEKTKILGSYLKNTPNTEKGYGITIHSQHPFNDKLFTQVIEIYQINGSGLFVQGGLKHLHQLQNLYFALTCTELEINL